MALVTPEVCTWIDGELYLPKAWFEESHAELRNKTGVPEKLIFQTKPELGWPLIQRTQERHIPFQAVVMDDLYGRNETLRQNLNMAHIEYYGDVPANTKVYLEKPQVLHPLTQRGEPSKTPKPLAPLMKSAQSAKRKGWSGTLYAYVRMSVAIWRQNSLVFAFGLCMTNNPARNGYCFVRMPLKSPTFSVMRRKAWISKRWLGERPPFLD